MSDDPTAELVRVLEDAVHEAPTGVLINCMDIILNELERRPSQRDSVRPG